MAYTHEYPYVDPYRYNDDWLLQQMKQLVADYASLTTDFAELKSYVNSYFANLDVQDEVDVAFNRLVDSGYFDQYFPQTLKGRRAAFFGDSLLYGMLPDGTQSPQTIPGVFASMTGCTVDNFAVGGAKCAQVVQTGRPWLITQIQTADLSVYDYIFFNIGTNDATSEDRLGNMPDSDVTTFTGAFLQALNYLIANKKQACQLYFITTPIYKYMLTWYAYNFWGYNVTSQYLCQYRNVPVICLDIDSGVNIDNVLQFNPGSDGVHLNAEGYYYYGNMLVNRWQSIAPRLVEEGGNLISAQYNPISANAFTLSGASLPFNAAERDFYTFMAQIDVPSDCTLQLIHSNGSILQLAKLSTGLNIVYTGFYAPVSGSYTIAIAEGVPATVYHIGAARYPNINIEGYSPLYFTANGLRCRWDGKTMEMNGTITNAAASLSFTLPLSLPGAFYGTASRYAARVVKPVAYSLIGDTVTLLDVAGEATSNVFFDTQYILPQ